MSQRRYMIFARTSPDTYSGQVRVVRWDANQSSLDQSVLRVNPLAKSFTAEQAQSSFPNICDWSRFLEVAQ